MIWEPDMGMKDREMEWATVAVSVCFLICAARDVVVYPVKDRVR